MLFCGCIFDISNKQKLRVMKKLTKKAKAILVKEFKLCLATYYDLPNCKRNQWRYDRALNAAIHKIESAKTIEELTSHEGAQWGGKWGNYCRLIAINSTGHYEYVEGFNPFKKLS